jgi:NitT/TauT family transport system substrate-binding protein
MKEVCPRHGVRLEERMFARGSTSFPASSRARSISPPARSTRHRRTRRGCARLRGRRICKGGARIVARKDAGISKVEDLKGRKVGTARGGAQELLLYAELGKHGLSQKDVQIVFLAYPI